MDLKYFYERYRTTLAQLESPYVVIVSLVTADGGKAGVCTEVTRENGARAIVESRARLATKKEEEDFRKQVSALIEASAAEAAEAHAAICGAKAVRLTK
jgi:hypothetical protein